MESHLSKEVGESEKILPRGRGPGRRPGGIPRDREGVWGTEGGQGAAAMAAAPKIYIKRPAKNLSRRKPDGREKNPPLNDGPWYGFNRVNDSMG